MSDTVSSHTTVFCSVGGIDELLCARAHPRKLTMLVFCECVAHYPLPCLFCCCYEQQRLRDITTALMYTLVEARGLKAKVEAK